MLSDQSQTATFRSDPTVTIRYTVYANGDYKVIHPRKTGHDVYTFSPGVFSARYS